MAIGPSTLDVPSYLVFYADHIEADLDVKVRLRKYGELGWQSGEFLDQLRSNLDWRAAVGEAEVVTISIGDADVYWQLQRYRDGQCGGEDNMDCVRAVLESFKENYDAIIAEILSLCQPKTMIRTMTYYYASFERVEVEAYRFTGDLRPFLEPLNEYIVQAASEHNIPVALTHVAFNGPDGNQNPEEKGYIGQDGLHASELGATIIADLFRELGYEPTCP